MKRLPTFAVLLAVTLSLAACGGGGTEQPEQAGSSEGQSTVPTTESTAPGETGPDETTSEETAAGEDAGTTVTTLDGERVNVGGGDATALFFMAGW